MPGQLEDAVRAVGGDDVVGAAVVERMGVRGDRGPDALDDLGERRRHRVTVVSPSTIVPSDRLDRRRSLRVPTGWSKPSSAANRRKHVVDQKWSALPVPYAIEVPDRAPKERYFDPDFYAARGRAAVAAGLADGVPARGDPRAGRLRHLRDPRPVGHRRARPTTARCGRSRTPAAIAACRLVEGRGHLRERVHLPVPRVVLRPGRREHAHPACARRFAEHNLQPGDIDLTPVRCELWGGCAWINLDDDAPPLRAVHRAGRHDPRRVEGRVAAHRVVVRVPAPRELEARRAGVPGAVPRRARRTRSSSSRACGTARRGRDVRPAGVRRRRDPVPAHDERGHGRDGPRQRRARRRGPARHRPARRRRAGDGDLVPHAQRRGRRAGTATAGSDIPDLNELEARGLERADGLLLPALLRAADVQQRVVLPVPPARAGGDADGDLVAHPVPGGRASASGPTPPEVWECDDPRWPPIPAQDFSNLPRQQRGLHAKGFEYMRLSEQAEGHLSNFERTIDGFLAGLPYEKLLPALREVNVNPLERPVVEIDF